MRLEDFMVGLVTGIILSMIFGFVWTAYRGWVKERDAVNKPTKQTPAEVYRKSLRAQSKILLLQLLLVFGVWIGIEVLFPDFAQQVREMLGALWRNIPG